jgi:hypothetical protein
LIPGGKFRSLEYIVRNPRRTDQNPGSFSINYRTGQWADFATNDKGGDFNSLVAYLRGGISQSDAARELADMIGFPVPRTNGFANGANHCKASTAAAPLAIVPPSIERDIESEDASSFPARTPPDASGKPKFVIAGDEGPPVMSDELRRHVYRRDGATVRIKIKFKSGRFANWYRVKSSGTVGWQASKPAGYAAVPYVGAINPFDPEVEGEPIFWPEGEKDCDAIGRLHLPAFTFGGTGDGLPGGCEQYVVSRDVVILADNDQPGREHAQRKAALIYPVAKSVKIVEFSELPPKGDVSDWIVQGHDAEELQALVNAAPLFGPRDDADKGRVAPKRTLVSQSLSTVAPERIEWLWPGRIAVGKLTLFGGKPGVGKSQLTSYLAATVSRGAEWPCREGGRRMVPSSCCPQRMELRIRSCRA